MLKINLNKLQVITLVLSWIVIGVTVGLTETETTIEEYASVIEGDVTYGQTVQVTTLQGTLQGVYRTTESNSIYASFENIPFAKPPLGELRFKSPQPPDNWIGVRDATARGNLCVQPSFDSSFVIGREDCLVLDVYTPHLQPDELLPVIVHIPGGSFILSTSSYWNNPSLLVDENVVFVIINYRLGALGFLSLDTEDVPGNAGLKDQVAALKWIRDNIASFGGNPDSVTVFGESAGGVSASYLQISPSASGLLHKVISLSGTSLCDWGLEEDPLKLSEGLVIHLGLDPTSGNLLKELQTVSAESIISYNIGEMGFKPVIEKIFEGEEPFLTQNPLNHIKNRDFNHIPTILGYDSYEYAILYNENEVRNILNRPEVLLRPKWNLTSGSEAANEIVHRIKEFYMGGQDFNPDDKDSLIGAINLMGDFTFFRDIDETARLLARVSTEPVYYYRFSYNGDILGSPIMKFMGLVGATHADELWYLLPPGNIVVPEESSDILTSRRLSKLFANFALTGNPTPSAANSLLPIIWTPVDPDVTHYMEFNDDLTMGTDPDGDRSAFLRKIEAYVAGLTAEQY